MNYWDVHLFFQVNHFAGTWPALDRLMVLFAGDGLFVYPVLLVLAWFTLPRHEAGRRHALVTTALAAVLALGVNYVLGMAWFRPRPFVALPGHSFTQLLPHAPDNSFPSDHAAAGFAFASATWGRAPRWISGIFTVLGVIVTVARVYVGVHWPTDVLAGMLVGVLSGRITVWASPLFRPVTDVGLRIFRYGDYAPRPRTYR